MIDLLLNALLSVVFTLEVVAACHCAVWSETPHGPRCIAPLDHPRCELLSGWHPAAFGINVCSKGDCDGS